MANNEEGGWLKDNLGGIVGAGMQAAGMLFGPSRRRLNKEQVEQQGKLNEVNARTSKELADYDYGLKMKMWNDTNYDAQMAQADKAGVSRAAVLGGSGGGVGQATTVSGVSGGGAADSASASNAATNKMMATAQLGLLTAQRQNIEADTENKKAGTQRTEVETDQGKLTLDTNKQTQEATVTRTRFEAQKAINENEKLFNEGIISRATQQDRIREIKANAVGAEIENSLTRSNINVNKGKIELMKQEISYMIGKLSIEKGHLNEEQIRNAWQESVARSGLANELSKLDQNERKMLQDLGVNLLGIVAGKTPQTTTHESSTKDQTGRYRETKSRTTRY